MKFKLLVNMHVLRVTLIRILWTQNQDYSSKRLWKCCLVEKKILRSENLDILYIYADIR